MGTERGGAPGRGCGAAEGLCGGAGAAESLLGPLTATATRGLVSMAPMGYFSQTWEQLIIQVSIVSSWEV